jgi:HK97 family phage prohead protease
MMRKLEIREAGLEREVRYCALEARATGEDGTVEGYGSVFGVKDSYADVVAAGAFTESLKAHKKAGTMPAMLWQHNGDEPIGVWDEMVEDAKGLKIKGRMALDTVRGREAYALLKMGALNGLSIGFLTKQSDFDRETNVRTVTEVDLWEVSLVTFPANPKARTTVVKAADVAGITTIRQAEKALRDAGFSDDGAKRFIAWFKAWAIEEREAREAEALVNEAAARLTRILKP